MVSESIRLQCLEEFTGALAGPPSPPELMGLAVEKALAGTGAEAAELFLVEESSGQSLLVCHRGLFPEAFHQITRFLPGEGYPGLVTARREVLATEDLARDRRYLRTRVKELGFRGYFCLPLFLGEQPMGCLNIATRQGGGATRADRAFLEGIGGGLSLALGKLHHPSLALEQAAAQERQRLARELHDGVIQSLGVLRVKAEYLSRLAEGGPERLREELYGLRRLAGEAVEELRRTLSSLPPTELKEKGLVACLQALARQLGEAYRVPVEVQAQGKEEAVPPQLQFHLLRFAQEALSNALRHSGAGKVAVELTLGPGGCGLRVRDDGRGFDPQGAPGGMGLSSMKERARSLGGQLLIHSTPGKGTALEVWLPGEEAGTWGSR